MFKYAICLVAVFVISLQTTAVAQDKATLVGSGAWKIVKSEHAPAGTTLQFFKDNKLTLTIAQDGKGRELTGTYSINGNQLILKLSFDGRERVDPRTIKKLTDKVLITEDKNKKIEEFER